VVFDGVPAVANRKCRPGHEPKGGIGTEHQRLPGRAGARSGPRRDFDKASSETKGFRSDRSWATRRASRIDLNGPEPVRQMPRYDASAGPRSTDGPPFASGRIAHAAYRADPSPFFGAFNAIRPVWIARKTPRDRSAGSASGLPDPDPARDRRGRFHGSPS